MPSAGPQVRWLARRSLGEGGSPRGLPAGLSAVALAKAEARSAKLGPLACPPEREARRWVRWSAGPLVLLAAALLLRADSVATGPQAASAFASTVASLSERGGYFDTDNLISNERSYLQVIPDLRRRGVRGGAYIGVGPDQNFSYISEVRPSVAYIIDVRRDNMLLHLLFKALFEISASRIDYLAHLLGKPLPPAIDGWKQAPIDRLLGYFEKAPTKPDVVAVQGKRIADALRRTGVPLSSEDLATINGFHRRFMEDGLGLRFNSAGRPPQAYYPTYRDLLLETDAAGAQTNYLASEEAYQFVRSLQVRDRIFPVVGDVSGPSALQAIGREMASRNEQLSAFYVSNVEFYLFGQGAYTRFVTNLRSVPRAKTAVLIRSVFGRYLFAARPGDASTSHLHDVGELIGGFDGGRYQSYGALVAR